MTTKKKRVPFDNIQKEIVLDILENMPENKKIQLGKALEINFHLTTTYYLSHLDLTIYKEGFYIQLKGTRCGFNVWAFDNDGILECGRKPVEKKLHKIYNFFEDTYFIDWRKYYHDHLEQLDY